MISTELEHIQKRVEEASAFSKALTDAVGHVIVGQTDVVERLLIGLLTGGHILLEGVPGLAKTLTIKTLASACHGVFKRIQFTPDLLPSDLIGTLIYDQEKRTFVPRLGPVFAHFVLADEINRAPAKVQSALLEAMQEKQVTIGEKSYILEEPFLVLATQNPIEQEGTYPLPEAQVDRFLMKLKVTYPTKAEEKLILERMSQGDVATVSSVITREQLLEARKVVDDVYMDERIKDYILDIVFATRDPGAYRLADLKQQIAFGASPRASIALARAAKARAFLRGRGYVTPEDIKAIGKDVLRHRILLTFEAEAEDLDSDAIISRLFSEIEVP